MHITRRDLLHSGAAAVAALPAPAVAAGNDSWHSLKIGVATYTMRSFPVDVAIKAIRRVGLQYCSIKDVHLSFKTSAEERKAIAAQFHDAGITPLSCGNVGMKNDEANIRAAFEYARDIGLPTIVCAPPPEALPILDKLVKEFDIRIAIHNHGPEDKMFPSPYDVWKAVQPFDQRIGLCIDVGHSARAGAEPAEAIRRCRQRLYDVHLKDIGDTTPKGAPIECGRGALNLRAIVDSLIAIRFPHHVGFEYEKDGNDPVPGLAESVGFVHGLIAARR